eukprot:2381287-Rhodomonas_salina.1
MFFFVEKENAPETRQRASGTGSGETRTVSRTRHGTTRIATSQSPRRSTLAAWVQQLLCGACVSAFDRTSAQAQRWGPACESRVCQLSIRRERISGFRTDRQRSSEPEHSEQASCCGRRRFVRCKREQYQPRQLRREIKGCEIGISERGIPEETRGVNKIVQRLENTDMLSQTRL